MAQKSGSQATWLQIRYSKFYKNEQLSNLLSQHPRQQGNQIVFLDGAGECGLENEAEGISYFASCVRKSVAGPSALFFSFNPGCRTDNESISIP